MRILFDMDGILADTLRDFLPRYAVLGGEELCVEDITTFEMKDVVKRPELVAQVFKSEGFFSGLASIPGAVKAFKYLSKRHDCRVATTAYGPQSAKEKLEWCARYLGVRWSDVIVCGRKEWINADVLIDDKPSTLLAWQNEPLPEDGRSGYYTRTAVALAWPYNTELAGKIECYAQSYREPEAAWDRIISFIEGY